MATAEELARLQQAHHRRYLNVREAAGDAIGETWDRFANLDDTSAERFEAAAAEVVDAAKVQTSTLAVAYQSATDRAGGFPDVRLTPTNPTIRGGRPAPEVYHRSIVEARRLVSAGAPYDDAMAAGRARATSTARTDVGLANRVEMARGQELRPWVVGYRRVLTGKSCALCATASTQRYRRGDLMPIHPNCDCDVAEIFGREDPGRVINQALLDELQAAARETGRPDYWNGPYIVDENGAVHYRRTVNLLGADGKPLRDAAGRIRRQTELGARVRAEVVEHGELGPVLTDAHHATTVVDDLAEPAPVRRTRATVTDPDVLAEARRRNVSPERVVEIREEKAERRFLEARARRDAERALSADSPEVVQLAERFDVHPDDIISARARVADVRKIAREAAARVQADAMAELQRLDAVRISNPPRVGARTGMGSAARRGEWDWLEQVSAKERARLSRRWYGGNQAPDQAAVNISAALERDVSVDEAMDLWLDLNRREEAAGALRRGKLPSPDAYSGQIDANSLLGEVADQGYDIDLVFGEDLRAAAHIARVEADIVRDEALEYLGRAASATRGPSPYRMSFQAWEEEVRDLEADIGDGLATLAQRDRYAELVPEYLDEPDLGFEDLYARIVSTARKAGEEVPAHARIPW